VFVDVEASTELLDRVGDETGRSRKLGFGNRTQLVAELTRREAAT
jgi:hypothetical protein